MTTPIFIPLDSPEAEEDNEPPSLENRHDCFSCPCPGMDAPSFGLTSKPKFIRYDPLFSGADISRYNRQGRCFRLPLRGSDGEVLTFFPWNYFPRPPRC